MNVKDPGGEAAEHNEAKSLGLGQGQGRETWKLNVQGVVIESNSPQIGVEQALQMAGIDPFQGWIIILKVKGQKQQVQLSDQIDLSLPGVEQLRLTPKQINNGEGPTALRRDFALLPKDESFLNGCCYHWQTINDGRRWLIISNYPVPPGFNLKHCDLAVEIPSTYPAAELDMFYCSPPLFREDGAAIPLADVRQAIAESSFQRWSRHRPPGQWSVQRDSIASHLGLVEESMSREVGL